MIAGEKKAALAVAIEDPADSFRACSCGRARVDGVGYSRRTLPSSSPARLEAARARRTEGVSVVRLAGELDLAARVARRALSDMPGVEVEVGAAGDAGAEDRSFREEVDVERKGW
jgi:hypothetical protein